MNKKILLFTLPITVLIISLVVVLMDQQPSDFESITEPITKLGDFEWINDKGQFVRTYKTPHVPSGQMATFYGNSTVDAAGNPLPDLDFWLERTGTAAVPNCQPRPSYANWAADKSDERLNEMIRRLMTQWNYVIGDIEFIEETDINRPANFIFIRTTLSETGSTGAQTCSSFFFSQAGFSVASCTSTDPIDDAHDCRLRGKVVKPSGAALVGSWAKGGISKTLMGVFCHEFGHVMGSGHAGDCLNANNTNGRWFMPGGASIKSAITIRGHGCPLIDYTLEEYLKHRYETRLFIGESVDVARSAWDTDYINFYENCSPATDGTTNGVIGTNFPIRPAFAEPIPDPIPEPEKELLVKGDLTDTYTVASYTITVDGEIRKGLLANPNDIISEDGITVTGKVLPIGTDSYFFTGNITSITANDHVFTFVDGVEIPNDSTSRIDVDLIKPKLDEMKLLIAELEALL